MKQFFKFMFASMLGFILSAIVLFILFVGIVAGLVASIEETEVADVEENSILHIKLDEEIIERSSKNPFRNFNYKDFSPEPSLGLDDILANIRKAKDDNNIKGIYLDLSFINSGIATTEEIRNALLDFKDSKKFILSYSEIYTQSTYYLASVADKIYMNPAGLMELKGLHSQHMFFKGLLEKLDVEPQVIRHGQFKSAVEPFILDKMSEANKLQTMTYVGTIWNHIVSGIGAQRKISPERVNMIADSLLIQNAEDAVKYKMIDELKYKDEILAELRTKVGIEKDAKIKFMTMGNYTNAPDLNKKGPLNEKIAVIYAVGEIEGGEGGEEKIGSERISEAIRNARLDKKVKAIVLRINSPGGSALASDVIWREVVMAKKAKPVIASMGDVAASGGYYIACAADTIVASPNTITGSIGVFGILPNLEKFFNNKLGITFDGVKTNEHADLGTLTRPLTQGERSIIQNEVENIYDDFISKVAEGRGMTKAQVDSLGQGRVWSGVDAKRIGLVDVFGGVDEAIRIAAEKAGLKEYRITALPKQKTPFEEFMKELKGESEIYFLKSKLGDSYPVYMELEKVRNMKGVQARLPFEISIR